ncbi:class A beta-lactamase-related serine hydrolase [Nocardia takedensis]|uniref:class A beta-lactamase-related serine hydrolase n=1 Tax=Nocardia takedensis TaxID=259390 RepID=UPI00031680F5|nr:class A beta-lactamase-related serine hydrolase [Nocardia takedensis]
MRLTSSVSVRSMLRLVAVSTLFAVGSCALLPEREEPVSAPTITIGVRDRGTATPSSLAADFTQLQPRLAGEVGMAIMPVGGDRMTVFGDWTTGIAWSTIKVPLAIAALRHDPEGAFDAAEAAITVSDNYAAELLWESLGDGLEAARAVQEVLDEAGDSTTGVAGPRTTLDYNSFGSTEWPLTDQVRFASRLPCLPETDTVTRLMGEITPEQGWGLGIIDGAEFKGGWGPDDDTGVYLVRQFGIVPTVSGLVAVAFAAQADSGTYEDGTALLDRLARLLERHLDELRGGKCPPTIPS